MTNDKTNSITGVILAGGRARRMDGHDKGLVTVQGKPMVSLVIEQLEPQVDKIIINANRNLEQYQAYGFPVISDQHASDYHGPLAGMLSALQASDTDYILTVPCDNPLLPENLVQRLHAKLLEDNADICVAHDGERMQPVFALIKSKLADSLQAYLDNGDRKIDLWYQQHHTVVADFSENMNISFNINTPEELMKLEQTFNESKQPC